MRTSQYNPQPHRFTPQTQTRPTTTFTDNRDGQAFNNPGFGSFSQSGFGNNFGGFGNLFGNSLGNPGFGNFSQSGFGNNFGGFGNNFGNSFGNPGFGSFSQSGFGNNFGGFGNNAHHHHDDFGGFGGFGNNGHHHHGFGGFGNRFGNMFNNFNLNNFNMNNFFMVNVFNLQQPSPQLIPNKDTGSAGLFGDPFFGVFTPSIDAPDELKAFDAGILPEDGLVSILKDYDAGSIDVAVQTHVINPEGNIGVEKSVIKIGPDEVIFNSNGELSVNGMVQGNLNDPGFLPAIQLSNGSTLTSDQIDGADGVMAERFVLTNGEYKVTAGIRTPNGAGSYLDMNFEELTVDAADNATGYSVAADVNGQTQNQGIASLLGIEPEGYTYGPPTNYGGGYGNGYGNFGGGYGNFGNGYGNNYSGGFNPGYVQSFPAPILYQNNSFASSGINPQ